MLRLLAIAPATKSRVKQKVRAAAFAAALYIKIYIQAAELYFCNP